MNLEELLDNYYAPKKGNELLVKLIESKINEAFGGIKTTGRINLLSGDPDTAAYQEFQTLFSGIINKGNTLTDRINNVNQFLLIDKSQINEIPIDQAFSSILLIQELKEALERLESSTAGFQMETIIAQLLQGSKLANNSIVDVKVEKEDFIKDFSLKTLKHNSLEIKGSFYNLCQKFVNMPENEEYEYLIITKDSEKSIYKFYEWVLPYENFFQQMNYPRGFLDTGVVNGEFLFKKDVDLRQFQELSQRGIKIGKQTYNLTKRIQERDDGRGGKIYFIKVPILTEKDADKIFSILVSQGDTKTNRAAEAILERYKNLKFIENTKQYFMNANNFEVDTQFSLTSGVIKRNIQAGEAFIGEFNLSNEVLKGVEEKYQKSLIGKMNEILRVNEQVLNDMNKYFATKNKQNAESALGNMSKVRRGFRQFSKQLTPDVEEKEEQP